MAVITEKGNAKKLQDRLANANVELSPEALKIVQDYEKELTRINLATLKRKTEEAEAKLLKELESDNTVKDFINQLVEKIKIRTRFDTFNNLVGDIVSKPTDKEVIAAIYDGLDDINSYEPETRYTILDLYHNTDTRWERLLYVAASKNFINTLLFDWTANGISPQIEDLSIESKLGDFKDLHSQLDEQFKELIEKLKTTALKVNRLSKFGTSVKTMQSAIRPYGSNLANRYYKTINTGRGRSR